jgi:hypothetical protein
MLLKCNVNVGGYCFKCTASHIRSPTIEHEISEWLWKRIFANSEVEYLKYPSPHAIGIWTPYFYTHSGLKKKEGYFKQEEESHVKIPAFWFAMSCNLAGYHKYFGCNIPFLSPHLKAFPVPMNFFFFFCQKMRTKHAPPKFGICLQNCTLSQHRGKNLKNCDGRNLEIYANCF